MRKITVLGALPCTEGRVRVRALEHGDAAPFPGHPKNPYSDRDLAEKLRENMRPCAGESRVEKLVAFLDSMSPTSSVRELTGMLAFDANAAYLRR